MDFFDSEGENTDSDEIDEERVSELYSVLHYNILSTEIPSNLLEKYDIKRNESNEILISFKSETKKQESVEQVTPEKIPTNKHKSDEQQVTPEKSPANKHESDKETTPSDRSVNSTNAEAFKDVITISDGSSSDDNDSVVIVNEPSVDLISLSSSSSVIKSNEISSDSDMENGMVLNVGRTPKPSNIPPVVDDSEEETVVVKWNQVISPGCWTKRMKKYYNRPCKRLKDFDFDKFREEIKGTGSWHINPADRFPSNRKHRRCFVCRQTGHLSDNCPRKFARCYMCSEPGHDFYYCPSKKCLNCGVNGPGFVEMCPKCEGVRYKTCRECGQIGHTKQLCPNTWRKYHSTTGGELVTKQESLNPNLMCCNCAKIGHLYEHCPKTYFSVFPPSSFIMKQDGSVPVHRGKRPPESSLSEDTVCFDRTPKMTKVKHHSTSTPSDQNQASSSFRRTPKRGKKQRYFHNSSFGGNVNTNINNQAFNTTISPLDSPKKKKQKKRQKKIRHNSTF